MSALSTWRPNQKGKQFLSSTSSVSIQMSLLSTFKLKNCAFVLTPSLVKLFCLIISTCSPFLPAVYACIQPVSKKSDCSNSAHYLSIALFSRISKAFQAFLSRKVYKHLSTSNRFSDRQYDSSCTLLLVISLPS